jgi:hypothetical protein
MQLLLPRFSRSVRLSLMATAVLLYFSATALIDVRTGGSGGGSLMARHRPHASYLLGLSAVPGLASLLLALFILHAAASDLFVVAVVDTTVVRRLVIEYAAAAVTNSNSSAAAASLPSGKDRKLHTGLFLSSHHRPSLFARVCCSPLFFTWQCVHRVACPLLVSLVHLAIVGLTSRFASLHTHALFSVDARALPVPKRKFSPPPADH